MHILLVGTGAMGKVVANEISLSSHTFTSVRDLKKPINEKFDLIIDFSHCSNLIDIRNFAINNSLPTVIATTGYTQEEFNEITHLSQKVPVLYSANFSLGITLLNRIANLVTEVLSGDFDIEVLEKHHKHKSDAPSGTTNMLINTINKNLNYKLSHGRCGIGKRNEKEIGVHTIRGGSIVGEHEILFAGDNEVFSIKHEATSKVIFAKGAIKGASWLLNKDKGLYSMEDVIF